jgi:hypothetical protein
MILHSSKKIRSLAVTIQASYMKVPTFREQLLQHVQESVESFFGTWMLSNYDPDRQVQLVAHSTWEEVVASELALHHGNLDEFKSSQFLRGLLSFTVHASMRPESVYRLFYPSAPPVPSIAQPYERTKGKGHTPKSGGSPYATPITQQDTPIDRNRVADGGDESPSDREGRIRTAALGALRWLIGQLLFRINIYRYHVLTTLVNIYTFNRIELCLISPRRLDQRRCRSELTFGDSRKP